MARITNVNEHGEAVSKALARCFQSGYVNFLIGSGASYPAVPTAGNIEQEIADLFKENREEEGNLKLYEFLTSIQVPMNKLLDAEADDNNARTLEQYINYLGIIETVLSEGRSNILPKMASIFTTNYDLFFEAASARYSSLNLNDGFTRAPRLDGRFEYSSRTFFNTTFNTGNLYEYKVEIPCINLIKLHGSVAWKKDGDHVLFSLEKKDLLPAAGNPDEIRAFIEGYAVVLPQTAKFRTTMMERNYYDLLRIYANELDRENALLVAFGFSFGDEHIFDITERALKNPTLKLIAFAFNESDRDAFARKFDAHNNVEVVAPAVGEQIDFQRFNNIIGARVPMKGTA